VTEKVSAQSDASITSHTEDEKGDRCRRCDCKKFELWIEFDE
jgi:hypothetical protein